MGDKPLYPSKENEAPATCPTCSLVSAGNFCARCGERLNRDTERSLVDFFKESLSSIFHLADSKLGKSLWLLLSRPGALTLAYMRGERLSFIHPFRVFLTANIVFFFLVALWGQSPLTTRLNLHIESVNFFHHETAKRLVEKHVLTNQLDYAAYEIQFNQRVETLSKSLVLLMIPAFALILGLATFKRRAYAIKHLVFSCHLYAHLLLFNFIVVLGFIGLILSPFRDEFPSDIMEVIVSSISMIALICFLFFGLKRAYALKNWTSVLLSTLLAFGVYMILLLYRAVLFFVTYYSLLF